MITKFPVVESCNPSVCISSKVMKCNRIVGSIFRKHLKKFNLTDSQLSTLFIITKAKSPTQKLLADMLYMDKSTVNRNLKRLIKSEYVIKSNIHNLKTTEKGLVLLEEVIPHWENAMVEIKDLLGSEGELAINTVLQKLT